MIKQEFEDNREKPITAPLIVLAALVVGALGGYAYGLGVADQAGGSDSESAAVAASITPPTPTIVPTPLPAEESYVQTPELVP